MTDIGIDLGTTYSCVIRRTPDGQDEVIPSAEGTEMTPSVVYFDPDGSVVVGASAKKLLRTDPDNVVVGIKRHMGEDHPLEFHGARYTPEAISGIILKRLAMDAAAHFNVEAGKLRAVITVPAYFGVAEKEATYAAARIANLSCMELLAEPVAAGYAYGADPAVNDSSLVFDLGGGTFDVAVVGMVNRQPRIWAVDGETQLGGLDWDRALSDVLAGRLVDQGLEEDALYDEDFAAALLSEAEQLKRSLSVHDTGTVRIRYKGTTHTTSVTRSAFEDATSHLVLQCVGAAKRVIDTALNLGSSPISRVLLVGGSTRMPMIRTALESQLSLPVLIHDPEKAVARGAAVLASTLGQPGGISSGPSSMKTDVKRITPVLPKAIGIKTFSSALPPRPDPYVRNILPANTPLPITAHQFSVGTIVANQSGARIELYEQSGSTLSEDLDSNRPLFDGQVTGISPAPAGSPIHLKLSVEIDGRISVTASDGKTSAPLDVEAFIHGVIDEQELTDQATQVANLLMVA